MKNSAGFKKIFDNLPVYFMVLAILAVALFAIIGTKKTPTDIERFPAECYDCSMEWSLTEDGTSVDMPFSPKAEAGQTVSITATLPDDLEDNMVISLRPDQIDFNIYIDGTFRYQYSTAQTRYFGLVSPRRYIFLPVNEEDAGKQIRIDILSTISGTGKINVLQYGDKMDIVKDWVNDNVGDVLVATVMLIISLFILLACIGMCVVYKRFVQMTYLTVMGILASVWILCNSEINQVIFRNSSMILDIDYMMLMLLPFPFLLFMNSVQKFRYDAAYKVFEYLAVIETTVCTILAVTSTVDISQMFLVIAGVFGTSLIMIVVTIVIDVFFKKERSYAVIAVGIMAGIISTLVQFALYLIGVYSFGGKAVGYALLIILATSLIYTARSLSQIEREKQIAVAEGKAESSFLANMSHEIRTPINAVLGMNEMILRETKDDTIRGYAENIDNSGNMLLSIVNDILDFSKIRSGKMTILNEKYNLVKMIDEVRDMTEPRAEAKGLKYILDMDQNMPNFLSGDEVRIKQIIINLMTNAVKYTDHGSITLKVKSESTGENKLNLDISVSDTGKGIREEDIGGLFDAFTRVDEKANKNIEGTGLGLALVSRIVDAMGGQVSVESVFGQGSVFRVVIPQTVVDAETVSHVVSNTHEEQPEKKKELFRAKDARVLVVDDNKLNLLVAKGLLKQTGMDIVAVQSGENCLAQLEKEKFDIVLLDHMMPVMDGEETLKKIKEKKLAEGTPIIALTANAIGGAKEQYLAMGFDDYLAKPVKGEELEAMLLKYLPEDKIEMIAQ